MSNIEKIISWEKFDIKEKLEEEFYIFKNKLIEEIFLRELNQKLQLEISADCIQRYNDLTWDYYIGFSNENVIISDLYPLFQKQVKILEKSLKKELEILELKLGELDEYIELKKKKEKSFSEIKLRHDFKVVNSLWEDVTNKKINKQKTEFIIKYLINFLSKKEKYDLEKLNYYKNYQNKLWEYPLRDRKKELIISDFFVEECEILEYDRIIFRDIFEVRYYYENKQEYEKNFFDHYLKKNNFINLVSPVVTTLEYTKRELENEKNSKVPFNDTIIELEKDIEFIQKNKKNYWIRKSNIVNCLLKNNFNFKDLEELLIETIILKYKLSDKQKNTLKKLNVEINIKFSNYKDNFI